MRLQLAAVGDALLQRHIPQETEHFRAVKDFLSRSDAAFFNLETTVHRGGLFGNQFYGGSFLRADPELLDDMKAYGFQMANLANNHMMDFAHEGLVQTLEHVKASGIVPGGIGYNLDEAAAPAYYDTPNGRIAMICAVSTMVEEAALAGRQSRRVPGRPGVNGIRIDEKLVVTPEQMEVIRQISTCGINAQKDISRAEGYTLPLPANRCALKTLQFEQGNETKFETHPHAEDMRRVERAIREAQMNADIVLVSIHSHEVEVMDKEIPAAFHCEFSHRCIDAGAHAVIGHGPHLLRGMELYHGKPIFYSLGDFILHNESIPYAPEDFFEKYSLTSDSTMQELFEVRSAGYTRGLLTDRKMLESVAVRIVWEDEVSIMIELLPLELGFDAKRWQKGDPRPCFDRGILERFAALSEPYGTKIEIAANGLGYVVL